MSIKDSPLHQAVQDVKDAVTIADPTVLGGDGKGWARHGEVFTRLSASCPVMPPGVYACGMSNAGPYLVRVKNDTDALVRFPDGPVEEVLQEIAAFQGLRAKFKEYGFLHKRGLLLHGPPGSGKTVCLQLIIDLLVKQLGGIALYLEQPSVAIACMQMVRANEPDRQILCVMEDFDNLIRLYNPSSWLSLMDGEAQVDNVVFVATTNYPEQLDKRFIDRPSRFDLIKYVGLPTANAMQTYLEAKVPQLGERERAYMAKLAEKGKYTIAHLKELVILTQCFGYSVGDAAKRIDNARNAVLDSNKGPEATKAGFAGFFGGSVAPKTAALNALEQVLANEDIYMSPEGAL